MAVQATEIAQRIRASGLVAIIRGNFSLSQILAIAEVLAAATPIMEVTLNTTSALEAIQALRRQFGDRLLIGAGTVRTVVQLQAAISVGAQFTVAPNLDLATVAQAQAHDILHLPGVFTPSEAQAAFVAGCRMVKLFPSEIVGPRYLKALRAPLDDIELVPTGGITPENIADYVRAGAAAAGIGSALVTGPNQALDDLAARAQALRVAWDTAKGVQ